MEHQIAYFYLKQKPFKQEDEKVFINGYILHVDTYGNEYETETIITLQIDLYLDILLHKTKYKKYSFLNYSAEIGYRMSSIVHLESGKISGSNKNGEFKTLVEI
jgi:hypothetical protein